MPEWLNIGDLVRYSDLNGKEFFDGRVTRLEVWSPVIGKHLKLPETEPGIPWHRVTDPDMASGVIVYVDSVEGPKRSRWGYGTQVREPLPTP